MAPNCYDGNIIMQSSMIAAALVAATPSAIEIDVDAPSPSWNSATSSSRAERRDWLGNDPVVWELADCGPVDESRVENAVRSIQSRLPVGEELRVRVQIFNRHGRKGVRWRVLWQLGDSEGEFEFESLDCGPLGAATAEHLHSLFPRSVWTAVPSSDAPDHAPVQAPEHKTHVPESPESRAEAPPLEQPSRAELRAQRRARRRARLRSPSPPKVVPPRFGTLALRGGFVSDFWRPWAQGALALDIHFPRNFALELAGEFAFTRKDLTDDPVQDLRGGGVVRACNLRSIAPRLELAICIGLDVLIRDSSTYARESGARIDDLKAIELAFSNRTSLIWWMHPRVGLSLDVQLAGRFYEARLITSTRLRSPRPFRLLAAGGLQFALPRPRT